MATEKSKVFKNIGIALIVFLALFFLYFIFNNTNHYKDEISELNTLKDSLNEEIKITYVHKDSILYYLNELNNLNSQIDSLGVDIVNLKKEFDEEKNNYVYDISIDSNIIILSKFLSKEIDN